MQAVGYESPGGTWAQSSGSALMTQTAESMCPKGDQHPTHVEDSRQAALSPLMQVDRQFRGAPYRRLRIKEQGVRSVISVRPVKQETFREATDCNSISCLLLDPNLSGSDQIRIRTRHQIRVRSIQGGRSTRPSCSFPVPIPVRLLLILGKASATH
jgi:hypothetical protein